MKSRTKKILLWSLASVGVLVLAAGTTMVVMMGPRNAIGMLLYDQRKEGRYKVGDQAPDVALIGLDGAPVQLASRFGTKPTVIIFGSFT